MKITIEVELDNAAFHREKDFDARELTRVLTRIERDVWMPYGKLDKEGADGSLRDYNGNKVGSWSIEPNLNRR